MDDLHVVVEECPEGESTRTLEALEGLDFCNNKSMHQKVITGFVGALDAEAATYSRGHSECAYRDPACWRVVYYNAGRGMAEDLKRTKKGKSIED